MEKLTYELVGMEQKTEGSLTLNAYTFTNKFSVHIVACSEGHVNLTKTKDLTLEELREIFNF